MKSVCNNDYVSRGKNSYSVLRSMLNKTQFHLELILSCSFTFEFRILHRNFTIFSFRSYGYATLKRLHYDTKAFILGCKQQLKTSS